MTCSEPDCWSFGRCVCGFWDSLSVALGLVSTLTVCCSIFPQLVLNWRSHAARAVSPFLFSFWLLADVCNLTGSIVSSLALVQIVWAVVVTVLCLVGLLQQVYYNSCGEHRQQGGSTARSSPPGLQHPAASSQPVQALDADTAHMAGQADSCAAVTKAVACSSQEVSTQPAQHLLPAICRARHRHLPCWSVHLPYHCF